MRKLTILVDMDDTIEDLCTAWVGYLNDVYGTSVSPDDIDEWDMTRFFPTLTPKEIYGALLKKKLWERVKPLPGAAEYLQKLIADGHEVVVVTASHPQTVGVKLNNVLFKYFPFFRQKDVIVASKKQLVMGDVMIDDGQHNLIGGTYKGFLMTAPHNRNYNAEANGLIRVNNWPEIYELIRRMAEEGE